MYIRREVTLGVMGLLTLGSFFGMKCERNYTEPSLTRL